MKNRYKEVIVSIFSIMLVFCMISPGLLNMSNFNDTNEELYESVPEYRLQSYEVPVDHTEHTNTISFTLPTGQYTIYNAASIGYMGGMWNPHRECWEFNYRIVGTGASTGFNNMINGASISFMALSNKSNIAIWSVDDEKYMGSVPCLDSSFDYAPLASALAGFAVTAINNLGASLIWTAISLVQALGTGYNSSGDEEDLVIRSWWWNRAVSDTAQYLWTILDVEANQTVKFSYNYVVYGPSYEVLVVGGEKELVTGPRPDVMSQSEQEMYGIELISKEDLVRNAKTLNIQDSQLKEFQESGEDVCYYMHSPIISDIPQVEKTMVDRTKLTKDVLLNEISEQILLSKQIVLVFGADGAYKDNESIAIVQKHTDRCESLLELESRLMRIQEADKFGLSILFDDYMNIVKNDSNLHEYSI